MTDYVTLLLLSTDSSQSHLNFIGTGIEWYILNGIHLRPNTYIQWYILNGVHLRPNTVEAFSVFSKLLNPTNEKETKYICNYISDAMKVR